MKWFRRNKDRDIQKFFESLTPVRPGRGGYRKMDRYRDFRRVFNTEEGRKVLAQIIDQCEGSPLGEADVKDAHTMAYRMGQRNVGLWIVQVLNAEPLEGDDPHG